MAKKNTKSRYWVDDNSILPEIVITPQGNYPVLDEAGNPARTVGAIQDINPNAHIYERVNTQPFMDDYVEGETNTAANQRADALDAQVVPHIGDFVSAAAKPLDALMPSRWVGLLDKDYDGLSAVDRFSRLFDENNRGLFINDNPYGLFSKQYAEEHPYWAMAGNMAFDVASTPFIWNGVNKIYNTGKTAVENVPNAMQFLNSPYTGKWTKFGNMEYRFKPGHLGINGTPIESRLFKKPKALRNSKGSIVPTVPEQQMAEEVETALPVRRTSPIYSEPITEGATSSSNRMAETLSPLQESTSGQIPSLRKFREMVRNNDRSVIDLAIADASNALGVDKQFILDYLKKEGIDINTENLHNLASDIRWKLGMEDRNGKIAFNPSYTLRRALKDTYIKALKNDPSIYQPTSDFIKKANLAIDDNKLIEKLADEYLPYLDNTEMNNVFIENILDSSKAFLDVLDNNPDLLRSHLPSYVRDFATKYNLTLEELRNIISGSNDYLVRTTISDWNNTRGYHPNIKQAAGYTPHYDANSGLGIDPISALFVMSRRGSSVHPNISRGDDLRAVADRTKYIFNEAMRPENHFKILESLGTSFSTDSGPLIISRAKKLSNARASRGAFPGAIFPKREYRSSNSFGNVNLGTADAPRIGRVFGASPSPEEILSYPSRQEAVNNMNYKLADFYLTLEKNSQGIPNMPVYGFDTQLLEAVRNAKGNFDLLTPELKQAALNAKFSNGKTPLFAAFPENSDYMNFPDIDIIFSNGGPLTLANKFKDGGSKDDYSTWKKKIKDYKGIIVDGDDTYDYYNFFKDNPQMAWDMLNDNPEAHFTDKYKTPNHPTYSNESIYSRTPYIQGGTWNDYSPTVMEQKWNYALSPSQVNSNWDVERTINYLSEAENEGAYVTDSNGRYPIVDGTVLGGTLTPVTITPNSHSQGGSLKSKSWNDLSMREKADIIRVGVKHGLNRLDDIKSKYNEFASGGGTTSELDWSPQSWFGLRTPKPDGTLYSDQEAAILASHVPEYLQIEKTAKANGTWLKMPDGSTWTGDPRSWVMMQSEAYKKNYSPKPWYTGQAEWPTTFDYGNGAIETNKVTRAPYYNGQMWFSDNKSYGDTFANYIDKSGDNLLIDPDYPDFKDPDRPIGRNFLSAVPQKGNYRSLTPPDDGTHDYWTGLPYDLKNNSIYRLDNSKIVIGEDKDGLLNTNIRADGNKVLTDDVVDWSKNLGDNGIYIHQVNDGPVVNTEDGSIYSPIINEFISQPGFTDKVKFIEGNTGDFDISNPYKYAYNVNKRNTPATGNYAALGGNIYSGTKTASQQMNQQVKQEYIYNVLPRLYAMDGVNVRVSSGLRPNAVVYKNGKPTNRKSRHGMGQAADIVPGDGSTFNDIFRVLNNPNSNVSRWMRANGAGFIDGTSATGTTKYWHDHKRDHSHVHHQIGGSPARQYATRFNAQQRPVNKAWERRAEAYWEKAQAMYQELLDAGVNPVAAAGILGNVAVESEFNPNAANSINGGHWGYLQNDKNITPWVRANYGGYDHRSQMNYLIAGLQGRLPKSNMGLDRRFNGFNARMQGVTDPEMAAYLWEREYEKSANEGVPQRKYFARYFYDRMMGNNGMVQQQYNPLMFNMEDPSQYNADAGMPENVDPELYYKELDRKKWEDNSYSSLLSSDVNQDSTVVDRVQAAPESQASSFLKWIVPMLSSQSSSNTGNILLNTINMLNYGTKSPDIYSSFNPFSLTV